MAEIPAGKSDTPSGQKAPQTGAILRTCTSAKASRRDQHAYSLCQRDNASVAVQVTSTGSLSMVIGHKLKSMAQANSSESKRQHKGKETEHKGRTEKQQKSQKECPKNHTRSLQPVRIAEGLMRRSRTHIIVNARNASDVQHDLLPPLAYKH